MTDAELLDALQKDIEDFGPLVLHDGYANCGINRGLACVPIGLTGRDIRRAIADLVRNPSGQAAVASTDPAPVLPAPSKAPPEHSKGSGPKKKPHVHPHNPMQF